MFITSEILFENYYNSLNETLILTIYGVLRKFIVSTNTFNHTGEHAF